MKKSIIFLIVSVLLIAGVSAQLTPLQCTQNCKQAYFVNLKTIPAQAVAIYTACLNNCPQTPKTPPPTPAPSTGGAAASCDADAVCEMNDARVSVVRSKGLQVSDSAEVGTVQTPSGPEAALYIESQSNPTVKVKSGLQVSNGLTVLTSGLQVSNGLAVLTGTAKFKDNVFIEKDVNVFGMRGPQNAFVCVDISGKLYNSIGPCTLASPGGTGSGGTGGSGIGGSFWAANREHIYKTNPGDVGINTQNPGARLEVWGRWGPTQQRPLPIDETGTAPPPTNQYFPATVQISSNVGGFPAILGMSAQGSNFIFMNNINAGWALGERDDGTFFIGGVRGSGGHPNTLRITGSTSGTVNDDRVGIGLGYNDLPKTKLHVGGDILIEGGYLIMPDPSGGCAACGPINGVWTCTLRASCP